MEQSAAEAQDGGRRMALDPLMRTWLFPPGRRADEVGPVEWLVVADGVGDASTAIGGAVAGGSTGSGGTAAVAGEDGDMAAGVASHSLSVEEYEQFCDTVCRGEYSPGGGAYFDWCDKPRSIAGPHEWTNGGR